MIVVWLVLLGMVIPGLCESFVRSVVPETVMQDLNEITVVRVPGV